MLNENKKAQGHLGALLNVFALDYRFRRSASALCCSVRPRRILLASYKPSYSGKSAGSGIGLSSTNLASQSARRNSCCSPGGKSLMAVKRARSSGVSRLSSSSKEGSSEGSIDVPRQNVKEWSNLIVFLLQ